MKLSLIGDMQREMTLQKQILEHNQYQGLAKEIQGKKSSVLVTLMSCTMHINYVNSKQKRLPQKEEREEA